MSPGNLETPSENPWKRCFPKFLPSGREAGRKEDRKKVGKEGKKRIERILLGLRKDSSCK
jgi:hypothetical protein